MEGGKTKGKIERREIREEIEEKRQNRRGGGKQTEGKGQSGEAEGRK
jgi:hypothetical protein